MSISDGIPRHESWGSFFDCPVSMELEKIERKIGANYCPHPHNIFRFTEADLKGIKVIILGRDPYPQEGVATGRAFEVSLTDGDDWDNTHINKSLQGIIKNLYHTYTNSTGSIKISQVRKDIADNTFVIKKPSELFVHWEEQGVLLLNSFLTVEKGGKPGSHAKYWRPFTEKLIKFISNYNPYAIWFLWGEAREFCSLINNKKYCSNHPSICGKQDADDFLKSICFKETKGIIKWI